MRVFEEVRRSRRSPGYLYGLGQIVEPSAVSAIVKDALGRPYPGATVTAYLSEDGSKIGSALTNREGKAKISVPASGVLVDIYVSPSFTEKTVPEVRTVKSLPVSGILRDTWDWGESVEFKVVSKSFEDYLTLTNILVVAAVASAVYFFLKDASE